MQRFIIAILLSIFTLSAAAAVDIKSACQERDEQKKALQSKASTSVSEALLAGLCTGYEQLPITIGVLIPLPSCHVPALNWLSKKMHC